MSNKYGITEIRANISNMQTMDLHYTGVKLDAPYIIVNDDPTDEEVEILYKSFGKNLTFESSSYARVTIPAKNPKTGEEHNFKLEVRAINMAKSKIPCRLANKPKQPYTVIAFDTEDKEILKSSDVGKCNRMVQALLVGESEISWKNDYDHQKFAATLCAVTALGEVSKIEAIEQAEKEARKGAKVSQEVVKVERKIDDELALVAKFLGDAVSKAKEEELRKTAEKLIDEELKKRGNPIIQEYDIKVDQKVTHFKYKPHAQFEKVLKFVSADEPVFLTGPAGSGKSTLCKQVAEALDLPFYMSQAVTQEYKILGYTDAYGNYKDTPFYHAFKDGGVFMIDEMDASIPEVLVILNTAIANRYCDFPAPIGNVTAHPDFRVIAAGNTYGTGADYDYTARMQLDAATLDRFAIVKVDYDPAVEEAVSLGNDELLNFCRQFRKAINKAGIHAVVSYRGIGRACKLAGTLETNDLLKTCLIKGLGADDMNNISKDMTGSTKWHTGFNTILSEMKAVVG